MELDETMHEGYDKEITLLKQLNTELQDKNDLLKQLNTELKDKNVLLEQLRKNQNEFSDTARNRIGKSQQKLLLDQK